MEIYCQHVSSRCTSIGNFTHQRYAITSVDADLKDILDHSEQFIDDGEEAGI